MSIKQMNATYVPEEDRVMFRLTTHPSDEYRLWLTRAKVAELMLLSDKVSVVRLQAQHLPQQAKAIASFQQDHIKQTTQFTAFAPESRLPLGETPVLVHKTRITLEQNVQVLHLELSIGKTLSIRLTGDQLPKLRHLLQTIAEKARWQLEALMAANLPVQASSGGHPPAAPATEPSSGSGSPTFH